MKPATVDALLITRALIERAKELAHSNDRHLASAGLLVIQDALEIAFYAILIECGVDEEKSLEGKSFDELIGELKKKGIPVPKSGTLKALNKQRVLTKHYSQVAEPISVRNYLEASLAALDAMAHHVIGRPLRDLFFTDFLKDGQGKDHLRAAEALITEGKFFDALIEVRKAVFLEFEQPYSVHGWKDTPLGTGGGILFTLGRGGRKAPKWTRNKKWIDENVNDPIDFIQIDLEQWRIDALEWVFTRLN